MPVHRHFLGWDRPVLDAAVAFLTRDWGGGVLDLSSLLVVVPTRHSGRRLRQALAQAAATRGAAVFPPRLELPDDCVSPDASRGGAIDRAGALMLWADVLRQAPVARLTHLVPVMPANRDFAWALAMAERLCLLRRLLEERGLLFADVLPCLAEDFDDAARWEDLVAIEGLYRQRLERLGLTDRAVARRTAAAAYRLPAGISRLVVMAVPDPVPLAVDALSAAAEQVTVDICVHAPEALAGMFDAWGRPLPDWAGREVRVPDGAISLVGKPQAQAERVLEIFRAHPAADTAVGVPDPELLPFLDWAFRQQGVQTFNPAGTPIGQHPACRLLLTLRDLIAGRSYEATSALLRHPDFLNSLRHDHSGLDTGRLLADVDRLQNERLPETLDDLLEVLSGRQAEFPELAAACRRAADFSARLAAEPFTESLLGVLAALYEHRDLRPADPVDRLFADVAGAIHDQARALDGPVFGSVRLEPAARYELLVHLLRGATSYSEREPDAVDLEGWLELHWDDAPHLILTGFNEGAVPETIVGDPFLPDRARRKLGLPHNDQRFARDVYLLTAMVEARRQHGSLQLVLGKASARGDALKPSRLLFLCPDDELPARARRLFGDVEESGEVLPRTRAWALTPPVRPLPTHLAVTAFRDYLACPFRFYLGRVVGMEECDDRKAEMDALDFGNLCHEALEAFGREETLRESTDAEAIAAFLCARADQAVHERYGRRLPTLLLIQLESARQRLAAAARVQAAHRQGGWHILHTEHRLGGGRGVVLHGMPIRGTVDRIDRHEDGSLLLLDYKTSDTPVDPEAAHLKSAASAFVLPEATCFRHQGRDRRWVDLQLPLYCLLLREAVGPVRRSGYFNLPKAVTRTGLAVWELDGELLGAADRCARTVVDAVRAGQFWPPAPRAEFDAFGRLFYDTAAESVDPAALAAAWGVRS